MLVLMLCTVKELGS